MYTATVTHEYNVDYFYSGSVPKSLEVVNQLSADLENVELLLLTSKGKEKQKLEGVAEALDYVIELLK